VSSKASPFIWVGASNTYSKDSPKLYILTKCVAKGNTYSLDGETGDLPPKRIPLPMLELKIV